MSQLVHLPILDVQPPAGRDTMGTPDGRLHDQHGREVSYLRLSITSACSMRCIYCRPAASGATPQTDRMSAREIEQLVRHLVFHRGIRKVRLTGGEPTTRPDLLEIIRRLAAIEGLDDLAMTTNGLTLARAAQDYRDAGLRRINVSLDSLDSQRFARLTGTAELHRVLDGIAAARDAGLAPIKLNTVVVRGENDADLPALVSFAADQRLELRLIELMPMGPLAPQWSERFVSELQMHEHLAPLVRHWRPRVRTSASAHLWDADLGDGRTAAVGFITAMSCLFCNRCDRIRIGADGSFYPCLMDRPTGNIMPALRPAFDPWRLDGLLAAGLGRKRFEHPAQGVAVMTEIGG